MWETFTIIYIVVNLVSSLAITIQFICFPMQNEIEWDTIGQLPYQFIFFRSSVEWGTLTEISMVFQGNLESPQQTTIIISQKSRGRINLGSVSIVELKVVTFSEGAVTTLSTSCYRIFAI